MGEREERLDGEREKQRVRQWWGKGGQAEGGRDGGGREGGRERDQTSLCRT